jgi:AraC-like DNA-binding protein
MAARAPQPLLDRDDATGVERFAADWRGHTTQHHAHPEYQLTLGLRGVGAFEYLGGRARIPPGCMAIFHPAEPHVLGNAERTVPWRVRVLHVPARWLEGRQRPLLQPAPLWVDASLQAAFEHVWMAFEESPQEMTTALARLAALLLARPGLELPVKPGSEIVRRCLSLLAGALDRPVSMQELARAGRATPEQVRRAITQATGLPPLAWHLQRRIQEAKHLLMRGEGIATTALRTGFADQAHLTRHFKRLVGVSPARYAQGARAGSAQRSFADPRTLLL